MVFKDDALQAMRRLQVEQNSLITSDDKQNYKSWKANKYYWAAERYQSPGFRVLCYKLFPERVDAASAMLAEIDLEEVPGAAIVAIGCGFGAELVAAYHFLQRKYKRVPDMTFVGIDPVPGWRDCFYAFNNNHFKFRVGRLSEDKDEQRILCKTLQRNQAALVILSHVVLDFANNYIGDVMKKMFKIKTLQCVVIMERVVYHNFPEAPQGCLRRVQEISVKSGNRLRETKIVVYEREPGSNNNDESSDSGDSSLGQISAGAGSDEVQVEDCSSNAESDDDTGSQGQVSADSDSGDEEQDEEQDEDHDVNSVADLLGDTRIA